MRRKLVIKPVRKLNVPFFINIISGRIRTAAWILSHFSTRNSNRDGNIKVNKVSSKETGENCD